MFRCSFCVILISLLLTKEVFWSKQKLFICSTKVWLLEILNAQPTVTYFSFVKIKKIDHFMQKVERTQPNQLYSLLSASQWKGDNYNSAQEKGCALERQLLTLNSAKVCSMLFLFFQWFTNGHFQNSEANFRTFLVRNTQVLFLLLCITLLQSYI